MRKSKRLSLLLTAVLIIALAPAVSASSSPCGNYMVFTSDGTFQVPYHSGEIVIYAWGAGGGGGGGGGSYSVGGNGGGGGFSMATLDPDSGHVLNITVGTAGRGGASNLETYGNDTRAGQGGSGGGLSKVTYGGDTVLIAAGGAGGGGGAPSNGYGSREDGSAGGAGGGLTGQNGWNVADTSNQIQGGKGGTQSAGGAGGSGVVDGTNGDYDEGYGVRIGVGGEGADPDNPPEVPGGTPLGGRGGGTTKYNNDYRPGGGGGGAGYHGGGGGGSAHVSDDVGAAGGGGGSSYIATSANGYAVSGSTVGGDARAPGMPCDSCAVYLYGEQDYEAGKGGYGGGAGNSGGWGKNGLVIVMWNAPGEDVEEGTITVTVVKSDSGSVAGIPVSIGGDLTATVTTNSAGVAKVIGLSAGTYTANASASGYTSDGPKTVTLATDASTGACTITLTAIPIAAEPGPGTIAGTAKDSATTAYLPGVLVKLLDSTDTIIGMDMTDPAGAFAFTGLQPGNYSVRGSLTGYGADTEVAVVAHDATTQVALELAAVIVVPPTPPAGGTETPPDLPKTGAGFAGLLLLGGALVSAGFFGRRK